MSAPDEVTALPAFSAYGVELEYMIVSHETLDVLPLAGAALHALSGHTGEAPPTEVIEGDLGWSNELVCHLLELKNPKPSASLDRMAEAMTQRVADMNAHLAPLGARLMPGGMHPWMQPRSDTVLWPHENASIYAAYDRIFDCRTHGWANLQSQHLNLPFAGDDQFARLHAAARLILPILPAIAASSPFREGSAAGFLDARLEAYRSHTKVVPSLTGTIVPDTATSREQYAREVLEPIYRDIAPLEGASILQHEWVNARGAIPRFDRSALEIRVLDVQECPAADLAIAAFAADAVRYLYEERAAPLLAQQRFPTQPLSRILLDCARDAELTRISDESYLGLLGYPGKSCTAAGLWSEFADRMAALPMPLLETWRLPIADILKEGTLSRRLVRAAGPSPAPDRLFELYESLCSCLNEGRMFRS